MKYVLRLFRTKCTQQDLCLQEQVSKQIAILFKDAPDLRSDFRVFIPDRSQQPMDGLAHTSSQQDRHRRKLDAVANSFSHSSLPLKRKRRAAEKEREREKEAAKNAPPTKVCGWYPHKSSLPIHTP
jgi:paired amphipathic helix protein Sin3a